MTEMTLRVKVDLPTAFDLVGPYADLVAASCGVLGGMEYFDGEWVYQGADEDIEALGDVTTKAAARCREMEAFRPLAVAPESSGDKILELTMEVTRLTELVLKNAKARKVAERALARITRISAEHVFDIDAHREAVASSMSTGVVIS